MPLTGDDTGKLQLSAMMLERQDAPAYNIPIVYTTLTFMFAPNGGSLLNLPYSEVD